MACKLDGQDVRVRYRLGGVQNCAAITYGSWIELSHDTGSVLTDMLTDLRVSESTVTRETQGIKSRRVRTRVMRGKDTITFTCYSPAASGPQFAGTRGYYIQIEITYVVSLSVATYSGVITSVEPTIGDALVTESVTVECDAD